MRTRRIVLVVALLLSATAANLFSQTLNIPPRPPGAMTGSQFTNLVLNMSQTDRENWVLGQVSVGNVPNWQRTLVPITISQTISGTPHTLKYYVTPDYLAIGSDTDYFLEPTTPILAQRIANLLNCTLPTRLMVNQIWTNSVVKMTADTVSPTNDNNATMPVFVLQDNQVNAQRFTTTNAHPLGALVSGDKKDEIISPEIYQSLQSGVPNPVVIYGWIQPSGSPIQPEFNGHAESYMDYSHGVRLVQMAAVLDGVTNALTNIMADPVLWPLVSDETTFGGAITKPYYTIDNTIAPLIYGQVRSQTVNPGSTVTLSLNAIGDALTYTWKSNGVTLPNVTNGSLTISNVQPANAATYSVSLSSIYGSAAGIPAVLKVNTTAFPLLFSDDFDTDTSANWNLFFGSADSVQDYTTNWAYNYGGTTYTFNGQLFTVPPAPNSVNATAKGVRFTVNNNDADAAIAGLNIYPKNKTFSGNFALKFDMWINYPGGSGGSGASGTTEYAIFGINHLGTEVNWGATNGATMTDGIWFGVDGEGGAAGTDYRAYVGNPSGLETLLAAGAASGIVNEDNTYGPWETLFPTNRFETIGAPGKEWVAGEIDQSNNVITWKLDGTIIAQRANTSSYTSGDVMIGYMDVFSSIASPTNDAYVLFDNVRVEDWSSPPLQTATISAQPTNVTVYAGGNAAFNVTAGGSNPFTYQWSVNGTNIGGATSSIYSLANAQGANAGSYSVVASNAVGSITSAGAQLTVVPPIQYASLASSGGGGSFQFSFNGTIGVQYVIQTSTDLVTWVTLTNVMDSANPVTFADPNAAAQSARYYRVLP